MVSVTNGTYCINLIYYQNVTKYLHYLSEPVQKKLIYSVLMDYFTINLVSCTLMWAIANRN